MQTTKHIVVLTSLTAALLTAYGTSVAEEEDEVDLTPFITPESNIAVGIGHYSGERQQFGIYDGVQESESVILLDGEIRTRDNDTGTWTTAVFRNLGLDNEEAAIGYERQGDWGIGLDYDMTIRSAPYTVNTGMIGLGTENQEVPLGSPPATTAFVPGTGNNVILKTEREKVGLNGYKHLTPNLRLKFDFKNEDKKGNRHWGRGDEPEFAAEPIDSTTRQLEVTLDYAGKQLQLNGGYYGSQYINNNSLVRTLGDDGTAARIAHLSLPLDNQAHQLFLNGGYNFTPTTRGMFRVSYTHATQDEHLPTSDLTAANANPAYFPQSANAPTSLDGELNTTEVFVGLTSKPLPKLNLLANLRYHKVDEKTPVWEVISSPTHSTPLDYETLTGKLEAAYRLTDVYSIIAGLDQKNQDRTVPFGNDNAVPGVDDERYVPFRSELDETTYRLQLRRSLSDTLNGSLSYLRSERDGSVYSDAVHSLGGINPVNIADRERDKWRLTLDWMALERLNLQFNFEDAKDDYGPDSNQYGLLEGTARMYSLDLDYSISYKWQLTAWYSHDETEAQQFAGRWDRVTEDHEIDKRSELKDEGDSVGLGLRGRPSSKLTVGADVQWTRTTSKYQDTVIPIGENGDPDIGYPTGVTPLPDIENKITKVSLFAEYALRKNTDIRVDLRHERWRTDDWTWEFSDGTSFIYTGRNNSDGTTVITDPEQSSTFVGVRYIYKFM